MSRRQFVAVAGGSLAAGALLAACGGSSEAGGELSRFGDGDLGILNYALTLEYVQSAFYVELLSSRLLGARAKTALDKFREEEEAHVSSLTTTIEKLGGDPVAKPKTKFKLQNTNAALELASRLENLVAAAYLDRLASIESEAVLATVLSIHSVEGRHAAAIDDVLGKDTTPDGAFAKPARPRVVLKAVDPFIVA